jgi:hypothetical protein
MATCKYDLAENIFHSRIEIKESQGIQKNVKLCYAGSNYAFIWIE